MKYQKLPISTKLVDGIYADGIYATIEGKRGYGMSSYMLRYMEMLFEK